MHRLALMTLALLPLSACASGSLAEKRFSEPNKLMGEEIQSRIAEIPFQHREELFHNLLWLVQAGEQAIPALLDGLHHSEPKVRSNCSWVLSQIGDRRVIPDLRPIAHDANPTVRLEVARSLVLLGDIKQCPPLIDALDSPKVQVRYLCHEALKSATGQDFGYDHLSEDERMRHEKVLAWRSWWSELSGDPWFAKSYATEHNLIDLVEPPAAPGLETALPIPMDEVMPPAGVRASNPPGESDPGMQPPTPTETPTTTPPTEAPTGAGEPTPSTGEPAAEIPPAPKAAPFGG